MPVESENMMNNMPLALPGFEQIRRSWDHKHQMVMAKIRPGEYYVTKGEEGISTVLGSCVSACIRDCITGIGGMNHFMLPASKLEGSNTGPSAVSGAARYGNFAMEQMINTILKHGGRREFLEVKLFGGARVLQTMKVINIGQRNIEFVKAYVATESLLIRSEDLGDVYLRKVVFYPGNGKVRVARLRSMHTKDIVQRENKYMDEIVDLPVQGDVELF